MARLTTAIRERGDVHRVLDLAMREPLRVRQGFGRRCMIKKILHPQMALVMDLGPAGASGQEAPAGRVAGVAAGFAAGIIGLGILGAAASARDRRYYDDYGPEPACYRGPRRCGWENQRCFENRYGDMVCRGGDWVCRRPMVCD